MVAAEADMLNLPFDNESFDVVIEKGAMVSSIWTCAQALPHFPAGGGGVFFDNDLLHF